MSNHRGRVNKDCCGEHTVCKACVRFEGHKCQRCKQKFYRANLPPPEERDSRLDKLRNWAFNTKSESEWDFRCLECGQPHKEYSATEVGAFLAPVDSQSNIIECTRFPRVEDGVCESCDKRIETINNHCEECRYWKAYRQLQEVTKESG